MLVADANKPHSPAGKTFFKAFYSLKEKGVSVRHIKAFGDNGRDFNDIMQENGPQEIYKQFESVYRQGDNVKRTFENEALRTGVCQSAEKKKQDVLLSQEEGLKIKIKTLDVDNSLKQIIPSLQQSLKQK